MSIFPAAPLPIRSSVVDGPGRRTISIEVFDDRPPVCVAFGRVFADGGAVGGLVVAGCSVLTTSPEVALVPVDESETVGVAALINGF